VRTDIPVEDIARYLSALQASLVFRFLEPGAPDDALQETARLSAFVQGGISPRR
jgi:hypothetical protein